MEKLKSEKQFERKRRFTFVNICIILATVGLSLFQLFLSNHLASFGRELASLEKEEKDLVLTNESLSGKVSKEGSLVAISEKAKTLSFETPSQFLVVEEQESIALLGNNAL